MQPTPEVLSAVAPVVVAWEKAHYMACLYRTDVVDLMARARDAKAGRPTIGTRHDVPWLARNARVCASLMRSHARRARTLASLLARAGVDVHGPSLPC